MSPNRSQHPPSRAPHIVQSLSDMNLSASSLLSLSSESRTGSVSMSSSRSISYGTSSAVDDGVAATSTTSHLPAELLQHIFSSLPRQTLLQVMFVNKWYFENGNMVLYQHVDIANDDPYIGLTLDILEGSSTLAKGIVRARLTTRTSFGPSNARSGARWIQPNFFRHSANLRSLHLRGCPFSDSRQWQNFTETLRRVCVNLVDIHLEHMAQGIPARDLPMSGLTRFSWHPESSTLHVKSP